VKRVDLRNQLLSKFNEALEGEQASRLRWIDRNIHSRNVLLLGGAAAGYLAYYRSNLMRQLRNQGAVCAVHRMRTADPQRVLQEAACAGTVAVAG